MVFMSVVNLLISLQEAMVFLVFFALYDAGSLRTFSVQCKVKTGHYHKVPSIK